MADFAALRALCEAYIAGIEKLECDRKPGEGIFGLKGGPADDPCHDRFAAELEALLQDYDDEPRQALEYIWNLPQEHREPLSAFWMLTAVHGLAIPLTERLTPDEANELYVRYGRLYPRRERLPVQRQTLAALKARSRHT